MTDGGRTVIIGMDGSVQAVNAFKWFCHFMKRDTDKVVMVYSVEITDTMTPKQWLHVPSSEEEMKATIDKNMEKVKNKLSEFAKLMESEHATGTVRTAQSESPGDGIVKTAKDLNADVIIMGSRGLGTIRRTVLGSVSDYVVHHANVPVIVCPPGTS
ncbi:universal stress protein Slr1101-like [Saccostrea cucullata]|uniref:universal stress protein Slr1101-like n=1 Tax=Saccostrea cuccullata TaxID=36930 RepID=UPI002ED3144C